MDHFKQAMSWPLFFTAIWLVWVVGLQIGANGLAVVLASLVGVSMGIWISKLNSSFWKYFGWLVIWTSAAVALASTWSTQKNGNHHKIFSGSESSTKTTWKDVEAKIAKGEKLLVEFTAASWVTCKVHEQLAIDRPAVKAALAKKNVSLEVLDWTSYDPDITAALARFGRNGVPLYLLYNGKPTEKPKILPQLLTEQILLDEIEAL
jgi:thiol:disulfide interchange protein DsbD